MSEEYGVDLEVEFRYFLEGFIEDLPGALVVRVPHSGKGRDDPPFDVVMKFDYPYYFDVVGTYWDENGYRLYTGKKDFYHLLDEVERPWQIQDADTKGREYFEPGLAFLAFKLQTNDGWRWYCVEIKRDSYFVDYTSDLRVSRDLVAAAVPLEDGFSFVRCMFKSLPLFKDRDLYFNQDLRQVDREVVLESPLPKPKPKKREVTVTPPASSPEETELERVKGDLAEVEREIEAASAEKSLEYKKQKRKPTVIVQVLRDERETVHTCRNQIREWKAEGRRVYLKLPNGHVKEV